MSAHTRRKLVVATDASVMHIHVKRVYHRHYPEVRGEGRSLAEAARRLGIRLARALEQAHGPGRDSIERALADVRALRWPGSPHDGPAPREDLAHALDDHGMAATRERPTL